MNFVDRITCKLENDLQGTVESFVRCFTNKKFLKTSDPILNWIEFVIHLIEPKEREVHFSKSFWDCAPKECWSNIHFLADKFEYGQDVNPFQSTILEDILIGKKTDLLWNDWEIHHFHLSNSFSKDSYFADRVGYHLFAIVGDYFTCFIDARPHAKGAEYADPELYKAICDSWPELVDDLRGITPDKDWSKEEINRFRKKGLNVCYSFNGQAKALGGILSPSGRPIRRIVLKDMITKELEDLSKRLAEYSEKEFMNDNENVFSIVKKSDVLQLYCSLNGEYAVLDKDSYPTINKFFCEKWVDDLVENAWLCRQKNLVSRVLR